MANKKFIIVYELKTTRLNEPRRTTRIIASDKNEAEKKFREKYEVREARILSIN